MGDVEFTIQKKISRYMIVMCIAAIGMAVCCTFFLFMKKQTNEDNINPRLEFADAVEYAENGQFGFLSPYECFVTDLAGNVIYSNTSECKIGEHRNLHSLSVSEMSEQGADSRKTFTSPLVKNQILTGMLVIFYYKKAASTSYPIVLILPFMLCLIMIVGIVQIKEMIKKRVTVPVQAMNELCDNLLKGNYNNTIPYVQPDEMGMLCRKVELVQEELKSSIEHAELLDENEKMLLACVSHDLKTPISTIIGCAEGIGSGLIKDKEGIARYSKIILAKSNLLTRMIEDILEFTSARMDSLIQKKEVYAREYIEEVLKQLEVDVLKAGLELSWDEIPNVLIHIAPNRIYQVFQNIISNSIKYTNTGGSVLVNCSLWKENLVVEIQDNGQGIAAADIPFIFDRFYRGEKARTQKETTGSGLGLSIVKSIIERHGGKVECESMIGKGTIIRFTLPFA